MGAAWILTVLVATGGAVFFGPRLRGAPPHVWAPLLGAAAVLAAGDRALAIDAATSIGPMLLVPLAILAFADLSHSLDDSGCFQWCAHRIFTLAGGDQRRMLIGIYLGVSALTVVSSNDVVVLAMTPIVIRLGRRAGLRDLAPYLLAMFCAANTASMALYIGNPTNIVVADAVGLGFGPYARRMWLPALVATTTALAVILLRFRRRAGPRSVAVAPGAGPRWTRAMSRRVAVLLATLVALTQTSSMAAVAAVAVVAAGAARLLDARAGPTTAGRARALPWDLVPFFVGHCVLVRAAAAAGLVDDVANMAVTAFGCGPIVGALATGFGGVAVVNLINNIPASLGVEQLWSHTDLAVRLVALDPSYADVFVDSALFAVNFGANLTVTGALAGIMWLRIVRSDPALGRRVGARDLFSQGLRVVPIVTAVTCIVIALTRVIGG